MHAVRGKNGAIYTWDVLVVTEHGFKGRREDQGAPAFVAWDYVDLGWLSANDPQLAKRRSDAIEAAKAEADFPAGSVALSVEPRILRDTEKHWRTSWGSSDRTHNQWLDLNVTISRVSGGRPANLRVETLFLARRGNSRHVLKRFEKDVAVSVGTAGEGTFSISTQIRELRLRALGEHHVAGEDADDWVVRVWRGDRLEAVKYSSDGARAWAEANSMP